MLGKALGFFKLPAAPAGSRGLNRQGSAETYY